MTLIAKVLGISKRDVEDCLLKDIYGVVSNKFLQIIKFFRVTKMIDRVREQHALDIIINELVTRRQLEINAHYLVFGGAGGKGYNVNPGDEGDTVKTL